MKTTSAKNTLLLPLLLAGMIQPAAAGGYTSTQEISELIPNHCTGEDVLIEGTMLMRGNNVDDGSGGQHGTYTENANNVVATGMTSGDTYTYRHNTVIAVHNQADDELKVQHVDVDIALRHNGKPMDADDLVLQDFNMHYVFSNDGSAVTSNFDFSQGTCE